MPIVNINVLNKKDKDSDPCQLMFVDPDDCGEDLFGYVHILQCSMLLITFWEQKIGYPLLGKV